MKVSQNPSVNAQTLENQKHVERTQAQRAENIPSSVPSSESSIAQESTAVDISENAKLMKTAVDTVRNTPDKRAERIAQLKKQIREGTYRPDSAQIADKLVDEHLFGDFGKNRV